MTKTTLIVRADAGGRAGSGHLVRSMALAEAWESAGGTAILATEARADAMPASVSRSGIEVVSVPASHPDPTDAAFIAELIGQHSLPWLCCDGYQFDAEYTRMASKAGARVLVIDDIAGGSSYEADVILNQNIFAERLSYSSVRPTRMLLGPRYALIRREFAKWRQVVRPRVGPVEHVLITMGGTDPHNQTMKALRALHSMTDRKFSIKLVVGSANTHRELLERAARDVRPLTVELVTDPASMAAHLAWADLAISAGGSTCYELCYLGVPSLLLTMASNQAGITAGLDESRTAIHLGWHDQVTEERIASAVSAVCDDPAGRAALSESGQRLVDGCGAFRVAQSLSGSLEQALSMEMEP